MVKVSQRQNPNFQSYASVLKLTTFLKHMQLGKPHFLRSDIIQGRGIIYISGPSDFSLKIVQFPILFFSLKIRYRVAFKKPGDTTSCVGRRCRTGCKPLLCTVHVYGSSAGPHRTSVPLGSCHFSGWVVMPHRGSKKIFLIKPKAQNESLTLSAPEG